MPRPNIDDELSLGGSKAPPVASGPIAKTQTLEWVWVWIYQNRSGKAAAANGGGNGPFEPEHWRVRLEMAPDSHDFEADQPAQATALAKVVENGEEEAYWWSEAIMIRR
jgi:hypothetical protein